MSTYWIIFIAIALASYLVQANLNNKFKKYSRIPLGNGMTGREVAEKMLRDWKAGDATEESFAADANGCGGFRGFYGTYTLELEAGAKTVVREVSFTKNTEGEIVVTV